MTPETPATARSAKSILDGIGPRLLFCVVLSGLMVLVFEYARASTGTEACAQGSTFSCMLSRSAMRSMARDAAFIFPLVILVGLAQHGIRWGLSRLK